MKLYEYLDLMADGQELTVWDKDYDMETYFYSDKDEEDRWQNSMIKLSKLLTIKEIRTNGVMVNLSDVIDKKMDELNESDLFIRCNLDAIMDDISNILSGNVSEEWMEEFVGILSC